MSHLVSKDLTVSLLGTTILLTQGPYFDGMAIAFYKYMTQITMAPIAMAPIAMTELTLFKLHVRSFLFSLALALCLLFPPQPALASTLQFVTDSSQGPLAKTQALESLKRARDIQQESISKIEKELKKKLAETQTFQVNASSVAQEHALESRWFNYGDDLGSLSIKRQEALLKQKLLDQLMFEIDSKWNGQGFRSFLEHSFLDMSFGELTDSNPEISRALFYSYMSVAVREIPEKTEDLIGFLIGYMNFSSVSKPRPPTSYMNSRNYLNGSKSMTANSLKSETISQLVEKRLKVVDEMRASNALTDGQNSGKSPIKNKVKNKDKNMSKHLSKSSEESLDSNQDEDSNESKIINPKESDKLKPSAQIINFAPNKVNEVLIKN